MIGLQVREQETQQMFGSQGKNVALVIRGLVVIRGDPTLQ